MAIGTILLPIGSWTPPDDSTSNAPMAVVRAKSSSGPPHGMWLEFHAALAEMMMFSLRMPVDYASAPIFKVFYKMASATANSVAIAGRIMAVSDGDSQDMDADALGTATTSADKTVPGTVGHPDEVSLTLTNLDSLAAEDFVVFHLERVAASGTDATGDMEITAVSLHYTTT